MVTEKRHQQHLKALQSNILFKNVEAEKLMLFFTNFREEKWIKNTISISRKNTLHRFYIIFSGRIKVYQINPATGREFTLFLLTKNDVFDIFCLLDEAEHLVYHQALDDVIVLSIPIEKMREWVKAHPETNKSIMPYLMKRMRIIEEYAANVTLIDISARLALLLLKNINQESQKLELIHDLSNEEVAKLIGSTRAVVNRHLQEFKKEGIISIGRKKMELQNIQLLLEKIEHSNSK